MSDGPRYRVPFRRRREGKTDYRVRLRLLKSGRARAVVRFTDRRVRVALVAYDPTGDRVVAAADSRELGGVEFPPGSLASTPAAYLTAYLAGLRARAAGTDHAVLDAGLRHPTEGGRLSAALKGLLDAGIEIPHGEGGFPTSDRLNGTHLAKPLPNPLEAYKTKVPALVKPAGAAA
ncbi:MAG TPA: 50S ribosomal protein L18 [Thermoplasmata archaeon]|jgi:large subunit ribosomal protein L18|nr:50S ribosomal protein L18 [Thermoplasmata archaeon]HTW76785.1 50S ribosomal protein L18 [Thermoplasmata archaeon]